MTAREVLDRLLRESGFWAEREGAQGLMDARQVKAKVDAELRYGGLFAASGESDTHVDYVYEVPLGISELPEGNGSPCVYFKALEQRSPITIPQLRKRVWNHGRVPTLCVVTPESVRLYDACARPKDMETEDDHLLTHELKIVGERIRGLHLIERASFDSGGFWRSGPGRDVRRSERIDAELLKDLLATERLLIEMDLDPRIAHGLLGRAIFVSYLVDRGILTQAFFSQRFSCKSFKDLLEDKRGTYIFFDWLKNTFNGDLFPLTANEETHVRPGHLEKVRWFLQGHDMHRSEGLQPRFWPYSFDIIPIELISSIYENFAHSRDPKAAEASSVHYTRINLVDLVLSLAMQGIDDTARVLDPACGSGVFLLEAFRRLAVKRSMKLGRRLNRSELHSILTSQIFGIDIDLEAVQVAAFSLYLALLELDPEPEPPEALRFPPLRTSRNGGNEPPNLYVQDFCNWQHDFNRNSPFSNRDFALVVGNVPWTALKESTALRDPDDPVSGHRWALEYCVHQGIPDKKPDQAFMKRARDFTGPDGRIALVVCSRIMYQQAGADERWFDAFLSTNTVHTVLNLSDLVKDNVLFGSDALRARGRRLKNSSSKRSSSTRLPASIVLFSPKPPSAEHSITFISPKWYPEVEKRDEVVVTSADVELLPQNQVLQYPFLWKTAFRGTPRDFELLRRLHEFPTLDDMLNKAQVFKQVHRGRGVTFGSNPQKDAWRLKDKPFLKSSSERRYSIDVDSLSPFEYPRIAIKSNQQVLALPALVAFRSLRDDRGCAAVVESSPSRRELVIDQAYYGISLALVDPLLPHRLNALLNSKLAFYMAFMFSPAVGWDRNLIEVAEWLQVRVPGSILELESQAAWDRAVDQERWLGTAWNPTTWLWPQKEINEAETRLNDAIFDVYELTEQERVIVEDTLTHSVNPCLRRKRSLWEGSFREPTSKELTAYAARLCSELNGLLRYGETQLTATVFDVEGSPLRACRFATRSSNEPPDGVLSKRVSGVDELLASIALELRMEVAEHLYIQRNLRVYESTHFWIIKPAEARLWSQSAALNDADAIVDESLDMASND